MVDGGGRIDLLCLVCFGLEEKERKVEAMNDRSVAEIGRAHV